MSTPCNRKLHSWVPVTGTEFTAYRLGFSCDTQCDYTRMVVSCANAIVQYRSQGVCVRTNGAAVQIESAGLKQTYGSQNAMWTVCCICKRSSGDFDINIHQLTIDINWHQYTSINILLLLLDPVMWQNIVCFTGHHQVTAQQCLCAVPPLTNLLLLVLMQFLSSAQPWYLSQGPANCSFLCEMSWMFAVKTELKQLHKAKCLESV